MFRSASRTQIYRFCPFWIPLATQTSHTQRYSKSIEMQSSEFLTDQRLSSALLESKRFWKREINLAWLLQKHLGWCVEIRLWIIKTRLKENVCSQQTHRGVLTLRQSKPLSQCAPVKLSSVDKCDITWNINVLVWWWIEQHKHDSIIYIFCHGQLWLNIMEIPWCLCAGSAVGDSSGTVGTSGFSEEEPFGCCAPGPWSF